MTERSRQAYLAIAGVMLVIGGVGVALGLVDGAFSLGLFRGSPLLTAMFVLAIGAALRWTALSAEVRPDDGPSGGEAGHDRDAGHDGEAVGDDAPDGVPPGEDGAPTRS